MRTSTFCLNIGVLTLTLLASFCDVSAVVEQPFLFTSSNFEDFWKWTEVHKKWHEEFHKNFIRDNPLYPKEIIFRPNNIPLVTERPLNIRQPSEINLIIPKEESKYCFNCGCGVQDAAVESRIVGGIPTNHREWSWTVNIRLSGEHYCGGSLITKKHVLTAAHCVQKTQNLPYMDLVFANKEIRRIESVSMHQDYKNVFLGDDIAIIRLTRPVTLGKDLRTICLPQSVNYDYTGFNATITGWGDTHYLESKPSEHLRQVSVPIISASLCKSSAHFLYDYVNDNMICAANFKEGGKGSCHGDSGGPVQVRKDNGAWEIIGIVSWARYCAEPYLPSVFTKVQKYLSWIKYQIGNECICIS